MAIALTVNTQIKATNKVNKRETCVVNQANVVFKIHPDISVLLPRKWFLTVRKTCVLKWMDKKFQVIIGFHQNSHLIQFRLKNMET